MDAKSKKLAIIAVVLLVVAGAAYYVIGSRGSGSVPADVQKAAAEADAKYKEEAAKVEQAAPAPSQPTFTRKGKPAQ